MSLLNPSSALVLVLWTCSSCGPDVETTEPDDESPQVDVEAPRPNIVLLVVDTLRADMVQGENRKATTPGFDLLAEEAVTFPLAFSHAPMTLPSHASLFSSRAPFETGVLNNFQTVPEDLPLLAEWLASNGYQTHAVLSLGTLNKRKAPALERGFDSYDQDYWHMEQAPETLVRIRRTLDDLDPNRPFFLFAHFSDPHEPYSAHEGEIMYAELLFDGETIARVSTSNMTKWDHEIEIEPGIHTLEIRSDTKFRIHALRWTRDGKYLETTWEEGVIRKSQRHARISTESEDVFTSRVRMSISEVTTDRDVKRVRYRNEVEWLDSFIREFVEELRTRGLYDNSIVVFTSDHGEALGEHGTFGHVHNLHDEMIHVPLVLKPVKGDDRLDVLERARSRVVPHMDVVPTILELAGLPALPGARGTTLLRSHESIVFAETHKPESRRTTLCLRDERYKLIFAPEENRFEMYDLAADADELVNVFRQRAGERPDWPDLLRDVAAIGSKPPGSDQEIDAETRELLDALGYGGDE